MAGLEGGGRFSAGSAMMVPMPLLAFKAEHALGPGPVAGP